MEVLLDEIVSTKEETRKLGIDVGDIVCFDPKNGYNSIGLHQEQIP